MKLLRKLCSEQVQLLLERMDTNWEDEFDCGYDDSKWKPMLPNGDAYELFTRVERLCIRYTARVQDKALKKELAYRGIMERTMSKARTRHEFDFEKRRAMREEGPKGQTLLTPSAITNQALGILNQQMSAQYAQARVEAQQELQSKYAQYKASGRYSPGWMDPRL